jgi:hypothetical protein
MYRMAELKDHFNSEQLLIIILSRLYFGTATKEEVLELLDEREINFEAFRHLIAIHGIRPFICHILTQNNIFEGTSLLNELKEFFINNQRRSMEQLLIISRLQKQLAGKHITAIPYKGVTFSYKYYKNLGLRESSDIDFLIRMEDADTVEDHLIENHYTPKTTVPPYYRKYYRNNFKDISYSAPSLRAEKGYSAEMHWRLLNTHYGSFASYEFFRSGLTETDITGLPLKSLSPTYDFLAVGSNHFVKDISSRFKYIIDIASIIGNGGSLDTGMIESILKKYRCEKRFQHGLFIIKSLLGIELREYNLQRSFSLRSVAYTLEPKLIKIKISDAKFIRRSLALQDSSSDKARFILRCLYNYPLPMPTDIYNAGKQYPVPFLVILRLSRSLKKATQRVLGSKEIR